MQVESIKVIRGRYTKAVSYQVLIEVTKIEFWNDEFEKELVERVTNAISGIRG